MVSSLDLPFITRISDDIHELIQATNEPGIKLQFVPDQRELNILPDELADPIADNIKSPKRGLVHRYQDRVLIKVINTCPVYCRFCFRKEMLAPNEKSISEQEFKQCISYIKNNNQIWEVILTGGDPLMLKPHILAKYIKQISAIPHVKIIRIHTRVPVVASALITDELITALKIHKPVYIALHANHPAEFTEKSKNAIGKLIDNGIVMLSQSVLLKNVNDNIEVLSNLMRIFVENRIKPYYLHQLDKARGTSHFKVDIEYGKKLVQKLNKNLSGLCQVRYMLDNPDGSGKIEIKS